ncbi:MAG: Rieske 2Fe-2S domain-containing protein [Anaerolineales bacterium]|nr:Rieske 2Fe-2S domain-containing protein [Anaerolineales bacterium]
MSSDVAAVAPPLTRREFLYYLWGASIALFMAEMGGALVWFAFPRFKEGEFGGIINVPIADIPPPDAGPKDFPAARIWLVNIGEGRLSDGRQPDEYAIKPGVKALYKICVHLGCLYKWVPTNDRFECPCHGSKYLTTGARIDGPATRNLDAFPFEFVDAQGNVLAKSGLMGSGKVEEGDAVEIPEGAVALRIDTGQRIQGAPNTEPGGGT